MADKFRSENAELTSGEIAKRYRVCRTTVDHWADKGKLRCTRTEGGQRRFLAQEVAEDMQKIQKEKEVKHRSQ